MSACAPLCARPLSTRRCLCPVRRVPRCAQVVAVLNPIAGEAMTRQLEEQIAGLQQELAQAHTQIHRSEDRLRGTVQSLTELEGSVRSAFGSAADAELGATRWDAAAAGSAATASTAAAAAGVTLPARPPRPAQQGAAPRRRRQGRDAGLRSTLAIPEQLKDYWFPVEFAASLGEGKMVPFELFGQVGGAAAPRERPRCRARLRHQPCSVVRHGRPPCAAQPVLLVLLLHAAAAGAWRTHGPTETPHPPTPAVPADVGALPGRERQGLVRARRVCPPRLPPLAGHGGGGAGAVRIPRRVPMRNAFAPPPSASAVWAARAGMALAWLVPSRQPEQAWRQCCVLWPGACWWSQAHCGATAQASLLCCAALQAGSSTAAASAPRCRPQPSARCAGLLASHRQQAYNPAAAAGTQPLLYK